jgi:hypothetical protein
MLCHCCCHWSVRLSVSALQRSNCCESKHKKAKPVTPEFALLLCACVQNEGLRVSSNYMTNITALHVTQHRKVTVSFVMTVRPSVGTYVSPQGTDLLPLIGFLCNLMLVYFSKHIQMTKDAKNHSLNTTECINNSQLAVCVSTGILHSSSSACVFKHNGDALSKNYFSKICRENSSLKSDKNDGYFT